MMEGRSKTRRPTAFTTLSHLCTFHGCVLGLSYTLFGESGPIGAIFARGCHHCHRKLPLTQPTGANRQLPSLDEVKSLTTDAGTQRDPVTKMEAARMTVLSPIPSLQIETADECQFRKKALLKLERLCRPLTL